MHRAMRRAGGAPPRRRLLAATLRAEGFGTKPAECTQHAGLRARRLRPADVCDVESRSTMIRKFYVDLPPRKRLRDTARMCGTVRDEACGAHAACAPPHGEASARRRLRRRVPTHDNTEILCCPLPRGGFGPPMAMPSSRGHAKFRWLAASPKRETAPRRHAVKRPVFAERTIRRPVRCGRGGRTTDSPRPARTPFRPAGGHTPRSDDGSGRHRARRICSRPPPPRRRAA